MPVMHFDHLPPGYRAAQVRRIESMRARIEFLRRMFSPGRVIPDPADLPIGRGRRIDAAILFLDISGFTKRPAETVDEQDAQVRVMTLFFCEMIRIVEDYGGTVEKNTGDGIMAYFPRVAIGVDVRQRAVACALTMFSAAETSINPIIVRTGLAALGFRICLDYGAVTIARIGAARRFNHIVAIGSAANRTSKMLGFAEAGELLLGEEMIGGLPLDRWSSHLMVKTMDTGWRYGDGREYRFWTFTGRWASSA